MGRGQVTMGKKSSSASAGTRKKHARKSGKDEDEVSTARPQRGQKRGADGKKLSKKERKALANVKQYIPPPKPPAPPIPDPLDGQGLARSLPAELVVVLRRLGKKDDVTRRKGLEELREQWVSPLLEEGGGEDAATQRDITAAAVEAALPVWLHNLSSLLQSPSHRTQALALHNDLLSLPHMRGVLVDTLAGGYLPGTQDRDIIGSWLVAALEEGRRAGGKALAVWDSVMRFEPPLVKDGVPTSQLDLVPHLPALAEYFSLSTLDPQTLHRDIHPAPVQVAFEKERPPTKGKKGALPKSRASPAPTPTPPVEEDTEVAEERWARYRVGGLVGLGWIVSKLPSASFERPPEEFAVLLTNPVLWSALGMVVAVPDVIPIGSQPPIRRAAYNLLSTVLDAYPAEVARAELLEIISLSVLSNCWQEKEAVVWEAAGTALLKFLTKNRSSWLVAPKAGQDDGDDSDDDDDDDEGSTQPTSRAETPAGRSAAGDDAIPTKAFDGFLEFVSTVCPSIPHLTYPLLVVIVSTVPAVLLPLSSPPSLALLNLFSHLWSPADARLLSTHGLGGQPSAFQAFLQSTADIAAYLLEKTTDETQAWLVKDQLGTRIWGEGVVDMGGKGGRRGAPPVETEAKIAAKAIGKVVEIAPNSLPAFMEEVERTTLGTCFDEKHAFLARALPALTLLREAGPSVHQSIDEIIVKLADGCTERLFEVDDAAPGLAEALVAILKRRPDLFPSERVHILSQGLQAHLNELVGALSPALIAKLFDAVVAVASADEKDALLSALWGFVTSDGEQGQRFALATGILGDGPGLIGAQRLDAIAREAVRAALTSDDAAAVSIASQAVVSDDWLSDQARDAVLSSVTAAAQDAVDDLLTECVDVVVPYTPFAILAVYAAKHLDKLVASDAYIPAVVAAHHLVVLVPRLGLDVSVPPEPSKIWAAAASLPEESKATLSAAISRSLAELLGRVSCRADPDALVDVALMTDLGTHPTPATVASTLLPPADEMLSQLAAHTSQPPHPALPVIDPQVPTGGVVEPISRASDFDTAGRSRAARYVEAGLALLRVDRSLVTTLPHLLNVALSAMVLASDAAAIPGASRGMYTPEASPAALEGVVRGAQGALSFSLSLIDEAPLAWHKATIEQLRAGKPVQKADYLQRLLGDLCASVAEKTSDVAPRAFYAVLSRHLRGSEAGEAEGEVWLTYAMQMSDKQPELAQAIILAIKPLMLDARAFDVAQNRLANALTGISIKNVNEKGVPALRLLAATAPPRDSLSVFLPQQRAVFVLRHVGGWLTSEDEAADDLSDEVDTRVAELYAALAPIVQDLSGAHWDGIFDLIESGLDSCALDDPESYPLLHAVLALLTEVRDLASSNKALRDLWVGKDAHLAGVVKLFLQCRDAASEPLQLIHAQLLDLLGDASPEVMAAAGLPELCELLSQSSSAAIQRTAYRVLAQVVRKSTAELVLEVEADVSEEPAPPRDIKLPADLVAIAEAGRDVDWHEELSVPFVTAQLLAWMAMLDHFDDASRTLRWAYLDQLTSTKLLGEALLPLLFAMLGVSEVGAWNFPASAYAVDEFYCDLLEPEDLPDLSPLASHVYYRTLVTIPSAMRAYYEGLKDRQLSLSLQAFTARNFSPVIIAHEFSALRAPLALAELTDEGLSIRIAQGGGGTAGAGAAEAIASYTVDEQPMEIGIRLPADFPLKAVDVRDLRRVGVPENKWRGWLMGVQQTITSRNGLILEALTVFKKNVALHFEGVVECAICYSIISLTDRTLPTKPCRTCKNRFHASCLFKWFNSSHTSSCPMCRSLF